MLAITLQLPLAVSCSRTSSLRALRCSAGPGTSKAKLSHELVVVAFLTTIDGAATLVILGLQTPGGMFFEVPLMNLLRLGDADRRPMQKLHVVYHVVPDLCFMSSS